MDAKSELKIYSDRISALIGKLTLATKSEVIYSDIVALTEDMHKVVEKTNDEMVGAALYNAAATIRTAPEKCPVPQLRDALEDAVAELGMMIEYFEDENA